MAHSAGAGMAHSPGAGMAHSPVLGPAHAGSGTNRTVGGLGGSAPQHDDGRPGEVAKQLSRVGQRSCGAAGNRTPDLLDANEARYQLRYSPLVVLREHNSPLLTYRTPVGQVARLVEFVEGGVFVVDVHNHRSVPADRL